nr:hypothetical protein [Tanacetum cinerariifolium]
MGNVPPPNNNPNASKEEPIMDQDHAALVRFMPQWIGEQILDNNNGWLEEEPEEEEENKAMVNDEEDDAEKMAKILRQDELRKNGQEFDITALDSAVRANRS